MAPALRLIQDRPYLLKLAYDSTYRLLFPFKRWMKTGGMVERLFIRVEKVAKGLLFDCRMCGVCVLSSTGMTCPMTCPKNLRNGPCGGVRENGHCEVIPEMPCVWVQAWERSKKLPVYGRDILTVQAPVDRRLEGTSAWINEFNGSAKRLPPGWEE